MATTTTTPTTTRVLDELLSAPEQARVVEAIRAAEARTSGQIKVHLDEHCPGEPLDRATHLLHALGLTATREKNAVLIYVAALDRKFAVLGDEGIHAAAGSDFWHTALARIREALARGSLTDGLVTGIAAVGDELAARFPHRAGAQNEISDDISTAPEPSLR